MTSRSWILAAVLGAVTSALYATRLDYSPVYLMHDEMKFVLQAQSIAATGRDMTGRLLPIFFTEPEFPAGRDPVIVYATAAALKVAPLSERSARMATALTGVLNVVLMFLLVRRLGWGDGWALVAAALMALTPIHFIRGRLVLSPFYSIPFILAWLYCVAGFIRRPTARSLAASGVWLGLGVYSYLACVVMMPFYLLITAWVAHQSWGWRGVRIVIVAMAVTLVPMLLWFTTHPERYGQIVDAYALYGAGRDRPHVPVSGIVQALQVRVALLWSFANPDFLFLSGDSSLINSTRTAGLFPVAFAALIPLGAYQLFRRNARELPAQPESADWRMRRVLALGLVSAPLASLVSGAIEMNRIMFVIPFGAIAAAAGLRALWQARSQAGRVLCVVLALSVPWQFVGFYAEYMGSYRTAASRWFGGNTRDAFSFVIDREAGANRPVFISASIPFADRYWRFYAIERGRPEMIERVVYFNDAGAATSVPDGAPLVCRSDRQECMALRESGEWNHVRTITERDGSPAFEVFGKRAGP